MSADDGRAGIFVSCTPEEKALWETAVALSFRALTVEGWARVLLNCAAASVERYYTDETPAWLETEES